MPRVSIKRKDYKILDFKGWVAGQMKNNRLNQSDIANALEKSQPTVSVMLQSPKRGEKPKDSFSYGDMLTLFELFNTPDDEKIRLLTL